MAAEQLLGRHALRQGVTETFSIGKYRIELSGSSNAFSYKRYDGEELAIQSTIVTDEAEATIGIFPIPPLLTPAPVARNIYLKFKSLVVIDPKSMVRLHSKIPIEIGVFRQAKDEELLIDVFSLVHQKYALYGPPETGVVCRFYEVEVNAGEVETKKYEEAAVRILINNMIDNVIKVGKVIIPMAGVVLDHLHDDTWLPGNVEMNLDMAFGRDVVNVRLSDTRVKRHDKTSDQKREGTLVFLMDAGY